MRRILSLCAVFGLLASILFVFPAEAANPWAPNTAYAVGAQVTYNGQTYECRQAHTSLNGWEPPNVPALWAKVDGPPTTPTPPTITPTQATPTPVTPTQTTPTQIPGCVAPAWERTKVYVGDNRVSHNGREWRARWWTQGEEPGVTTSGVWEDKGACGGTVTPTPITPTPITPTPITPTPITPTPITTTPTPCPNCGDGLPKRLIVGYWHNFDNGSGFIRLRDVSPKFDIIQVAFAEPTNGATSGIIGFTPYGMTKEEFKADVAYLKSQGKKVLISIGGANGQVQLIDATARQNFVNSMTAIINEYGFDGLDIDFEGHSLYLNAGDNDFRNPTTPVITNLIAAIRSLHNTFGSRFLLTMAPETFFVQVGYTFYGGSCISCDNRAGAYLPVIYALRDILTVLHVQDYNSGPIRALDNTYYSMGNADFHVAMMDMLLTGFPIAGNTAYQFPALRPEQIAIGLPANVNAGGGFTAVAEVHKALDYLIKGRSFGGSYVLRNPAGYPNFRGLMTWSINWDAFNNFEFSTRHRAYLDALN